MGSSDPFGEGVAIIYIYSCKVKNWSKIWGVFKLKTGPSLKLKTGPSLKLKTGPSCLFSLFSPIFIVFWGYF